MNTAVHPIDLQYLECDVPQDQLLREYGRALAHQRHEQRAGRSGHPSRVRALVMACHALRGVRG
jgi:hypothetical protein